MIRWTIKFTITELHLIFILVAGLHLGLVAYKLEGQHYNVTKEQLELEKKKQLEKKDEDPSNPEEGIAQGKGLVRKPFVITYLGDLKVRRHSELLSLLSGKFSQTTTVIGSNVGVRSSKVEAVAITATPDVKFKITNEQKKNVIRRLIKEHMKDVNICKEKSLIDDEFLMGTLRINMRIKGRSNLARPQFNGHGDRKVISSLENCVKAKLVAITFPDELNDQEISFDIKVN